MLYSFIYEISDYYVARVWESKFEIIFHFLNFCFIQGSIQSTESWYDPKRRDFPLFQGGKTSLVLPDINEISEKINK